MAASAAMALPESLEKVALALDQIHLKDESGTVVMHQTSKPRNPRKGEDPNGIYWFNDAERLHKLYLYCIADVEAERETERLLNQYALSPQEQQLWQLDQVINRRGFAIDLPLVEAAHRIEETGKDRIKAEIAAVTDGVVKSINAKNFAQWFTDHGHPTKTIGKEFIEGLLARDDLDPVVRKVAALRQSGAQQSKLAALLSAVCEDHRIRGSLRFSGTGTRRWAGQLVQPQNFRKPRISPGQVEKAIELIMTGDYHALRAVFDLPLSILADCTRAMVVAAPGHVLFGGDFSAIEDRVGAWISGALQKLADYARFDQTGNYADEPYCILGAAILGINDLSSMHKDHPARKLGKILSLAFQYQGGLPAYRGQDPSGRYSDDEVRKLQKKWRAENSDIVRFWGDIDAATKKAISNPGEYIDDCPPVRLICNGRYLFIELPSGGRLSYPYPRIIFRKNNKGYDEKVVVFRDNGGDPPWSLCKNGYGFYGGCWFENLVSTISRDILAEAIQRLEAAGYRVVLSVHDEILCEGPIGFGNLEEFKQIMTEVPGWAEGLPIAAKCWTGPRFSKG
jgi:DNA polymerase